ncbi:hypothetical protein VT84_02720 [Gemmata sp. SH-PL17]|uniref:hypothetical protein n=1 Tax=Gemmata sp. SH-PL17 TaxID=1630693 RepID=UPI00078E29B9|nr:hypothetical protein [Gemmata sp. SH-PL17]AMV23294.1 hypothetical protein VT84_02720 [Gemmata sp. SH-PL17]
MRCFSLAFACAFLATEFAEATSPNPADLAVVPEIQVKARALVRQLGSEDFDEREGAEQQLEDLGRLARAALTAGATTNPDPEIRSRCQRLLPHAIALDTKARLDTFLADTKGEYEHDLPAWKTFRSVVGSEWAFFGLSVWSDRELDAAARRVFTELVSTSANRRLLLAVDGPRTALADLVVWRRLDLYNLRSVRTDGEPREPTLEDVTALLFAESGVGSQYMLQRRGSTSSLMSESGFTRAVRGKDEKSLVYRAVLIAWLDSRDESREMSQALNIAQNLDLTDQACGLAARLLTTSAINPSSRGRGATSLAAIGSRKHLPLLNKALTDTLTVYTVRPVTSTGEAEAATYDVQVRDLALAVSILLTEQKLSDYGFVDRFGTSSSADRLSFSYTRHYFPDNAAQKAAFAKWEKWCKASE